MKECLGEVMLGEKRLFQTHLSGTTEDSEAIFTSTSKHDGVTM